MGAWGVLAGPLIAAAAGGLAVLVAGACVLVARGWARLTAARRLVRRVIEEETARHVRDLVPPQRRPTEPQGWWEFTLRQPGGDD